MRVAPLFVGKGTMTDDPMMTTLPFPLTCRDAEVNFNLRMSVIQMVAQFSQFTPIILPPMTRFITQSMQVLGLLNIEANSTGDWEKNELTAPFTFFEPDIGSVLWTACDLNADLFEHVLEHSDQDELDIIQAVGNWYGTEGDMLQLMRQTRDVLVEYKNYIEEMGVKINGYGI